MRKKYIQKLNNAMLEDVEVSDGVLDMARAQMRAETPETNTETASSPVKVKRARAAGVKGGAVAVNRKAVVAVCACALVAVIIVASLAAWFNRGISNSSDSGGKSYNIAELTASEITSVGDYNTENGTTYLCFEDVQTSTVVYLSGGTPVLFEENFTYGETNCTWYVLVNFRDYVDALVNFEQLFYETQIGGYTVYYNSTDDCQYAALYYNASRYCLSVESSDARTAFEILEYILN